MASKKGETKDTQEAFVDEPYSEQDVLTMHEFKSGKKLRKNKKEIHFGPMPFMQGDMDMKQIQKRKTLDLNTGGFLHTKAVQKKYYKDIL